MSQILHTKDYGDIEVENSFVRGNLHVVELTGGGYAHSSGLPVQSKQELREAIPPGPALEAALHWWEHRNDEVEAPKRSILIKPDGTITFDDGSPVESISQIIQHVPQGPFLDAAVETFTKMKSAAQEVEAAAETVAGQAAKKVITKPKPLARPKTRKPPPKPAADFTPPPSETEEAAMGA